MAWYGHDRIRSIEYSYTGHSFLNLTVCRGFQFGGTELEGVLEVQLGWHEDDTYTMDVTCHNEAKVSYMELLFATRRCFIPLAYVAR
jgi:hypothetical protein